MRSRSRSLGRLAERANVGHPGSRRDPYLHIPGRAPEPDNVYGDARFGRLTDGFA